MRAGFLAIRATIVRLFCSRNVSVSMLAFSGWYGSVGFVDAVLVGLVETCRVCVNAMFLEDDFRILRKEV